MHAFTGWRPMWRPVHLRNAYSGAWALGLGARCPTRASLMGCMAGYPQGGKKIALRGGGGVWHGSPFAQPPPLPLLGRRAGRGGLGWRCPTCRDGGGSDPNILAQNDPHVALIILTTHMWGKIFS